MSKNLDEQQKEITEIRTDIGERMEGVYNNFNRVDSQVKKNQGRIEEIHQREVKLQEVVDSWQDRTCHSTHVINNESRELINFRNHRRNPMGFLERLEEMVEKNRDPMDNGARNDR